MTLSDLSLFPACGCYAALAARDYHALDRLSSHRLQLFKRSPAHYRHYDANPEPATPAQAFGEMLHLAVLEPDRYAREVVLTDAGTRTKAYAELVETHGAARVATREDAAHLGAMRQALARHPAAAALLHPQAPRELSIVFDREAVCTDSGECVAVACKSRLDVFDADHRRIVDVKSARDASPRAFGRAAHDYGYLLQGAFYACAAAAATGEAPHAFEVVFVAVEKAPPYAVGVYRVDGPALARALAEVETLVEAYARCRRDDCWPAYSPHVEPLALPPWAL